METSVKTLQDVQNVPADKLIPLVEWREKNASYCRFCGEKLHCYTVVKPMRENISQLCACETAQAALKHNKRVNPLYEERQEID